jgi:hypothetical protein
LGSSTWAVLALLLTPTRQADRPGNCNLTVTADAIHVLPHAYLRVMCDMTQDLGTKK